MKSFAALVFSFLLCSILPLIADEERDAFADFQRTVQAADVIKSLESFKRDHPASASKEELEKFEKSLVIAALAAFDNGERFRSHFPQSKNLPELQRLIVEPLFMVFDGVRLPVPKNRAPDLEKFVRTLLMNAPE